MYITDSTNYTVQVFDSDCKFLFKFGSIGTGNGQFHRPNGIAINSSNQIIVADNSNCRVQVFNVNGSFQFAFGKEGSSNGEITNIEGLAVDSNDSTLNIPLDLILQIFW